MNFSKNGNRSLVKKHENEVPGILCFGADSELKLTVKAKNPHLLPLGNELANFISDESGNSVNQDFRVIPRPNMVFVVSSVVPDIEINKSRLATFVTTQLGIMPSDLEMEVQDSSW